MPDVLFDFPIRASADRVFEAVSTPAGLDRWWTLRAAGEARVGATFELDFGPDYDWRAVVTACEPGALFELELTRAMPDWLGSRVRLELSEGTGAGAGATLLRFAHLGWAEPTEHFRVSSFCWAMYLRLMRRGLEYGEEVPYDARLDA